MTLGVLEIRDAVRSRRLGAADAVREAIRQIRKVDPILQAASQVFEEDALRAAADIDRRLERGEDPGPLAGVPFTVKENICTRLGRTTAASRILETYRAPYDATVVERLSRAGAVCVAKTNMDEFGMGSSTENSAFQPSRNPWKESHVPGGSSGGAAALASATRGMIMSVGSSASA